ncbi:MAG: hypothetical protein JNG90_01215, partial [Planctomycetaceae bacterium]|nr:hypothetical protein [Planctomycetaceae bacterium]
MFEAVNADLELTYSPRMWNVFSPTSSPIQRRRLDRRTLVLGGTLAVLLGCLAAGATALSLPVPVHEGSGFRATAGLLLILLALAQARILYPRRISRERLAAVGLGCWPGGVLIALASFALVLALGPAAGSGFLFLALVAAGHTGLLAAVRWPEKFARTRALLKRRHVRGAGWSLVACGLALATLEAGLRIYGQLADDRLPVAIAVQAQRLPPGAQVRGATVNQLGYWGRDFHPAPRPGVFRMAVLGDELALSGTATTNCFA